jgi:hypothetical protein
MNKKMNKNNEDLFCAIYVLVRYPFIVIPFIIKTQIMILKFKLKMKRLERKTPRGKVMNKEVT